MNTQLYLIYQIKDEIKKKPISDMDKAETVVKLSETKKIKIDNEEVHIVGIGTDADFIAHKQILNKSDYNDLPHFKELQANIKHLKTYGTWPKE